MKVVFMVLLMALMASCATKEKPAIAETKAEEVVSLPKNDRPVMQINLTDGRQLEAKTISENMVLILFQPDCDHCQHEAIDIQKRLAEFSNYQLYFVSSHPLALITKFAKDYKLNDKPNVHFGSASVESVLSNFGAISAPSIYIYSNDGKLKKSFNGQTDVELLIKSL